MVTSFDAGAERAAIEMGLAEARSRTSADIRVVTLPASSHYGAFAPIQALLSGLIASAAMAIVFPAIGARPAFEIEGLIVLAALSCLQNTWLRFQLTPRRAQLKAASRQARIVYARLVLKDRGTGPVVLLFCSHAERHIEVLTSDAVMAHVPADEWHAAIAGFQPHMRAGNEPAAFHHLIDHTASLLAPHFPPEPPARGLLT